MDLDSRSGGCHVMDWRWRQLRRWIWRWWVRRMSCDGFGGGGNDVSDIRDCRPSSLIG